MTDGLSGYGSDLPTDSLMSINATADRVFEFERAQQALDAIQDGRFMGKIVARL